MAYGRFILLKPDVGIKENAALIAVMTGLTIYQQYQSSATFDPYQVTTFIGALVLIAQRLVDKKNTKAKESELAIYKDASKSDDID